MMLRRGGTAIFRSNNGFVESTSAYHFRNPSGRHTGRFMRLSNILVQQAEITFIALCALRHVPEATRRIYVDTPSLFAVVAALNDLRASEGQLEPIAADSYRSYDHVKTYKYFQTADAVALVSASSSGGLARRLEKRGFRPQAIVHILFLGELVAPLVAAVDLTVDTTDNPLGCRATKDDNSDDKCSLCDTGSLPISLHGDQFDIAGPQPEPLVITRTPGHAALRDTLARHAASGAFRVNGGRPLRQYAIDPDRVCASGPALARLNYLAAARVPAKLGHCIVANAGSAAFAQRVLAAAGASAPILQPDQFDELAARSGPFNEPILIASAVVGSGRQLLDISRRLRSCPQAPLIYLAGIVATPSPERTKTLEASLALTPNEAPHSFHFVDELNLPPASAPNPWDAELSLLDSVANTGAALSSELSARRNRLRRTSLPLDSDLFLTNGPAAPLVLNSGFAFWDAATVAGAHTQADVYYTISAVLQGLRTAEPSSGRKTLRNEWFYRTLIAPENFGRFNDPIIQASLLRAARPSELDFTDNRAASEEAARLIRRILESAGTARGEAAAEFLIALAMGRLRLAANDLRLMLDGLPAPTKLVGDLISLCRSRLL